MRHNVVDRADVRSAADLSQRGRLVLLRFFRNEVCMIGIGLGSDHGSIGDAVHRKSNLFRARR